MGKKHTVQKLVLDMIAMHGMMHSILDNLAERDEAKLARQRPGEPAPQSKLVEG